MLPNIVDNEAYILSIFIMKIETVAQKRFFMVILVTILIFSYFLIRNYLSLIITTFLIVMLFQPVYGTLLRTFKHNKSIATIVSILTVILTFLVPVLLIINLTIIQAQAFSSDINTLITSNNINYSDTLNIVNEGINKIPYVDYELTEEKVVDSIQAVATGLAGFLQNNIQNFITSSADFITKVIVFFVLLSTLFPNYHKVLHLFKEISPLDNQMDKLYLDRFVAMSKSMVKGTLVIVLMQGITCGIVLYFLQVPYVFFLTIMMVFLALIPVGVWGVMLPTAIYFGATGNIPALLIVVITTLIVTNIDSVIRPKLVSPDADMNPALLILSIFGGLQLFGFLGIIYGPVIMIFLVTTIEIYLKYYATSTKTSSEDASNN